MNLSEPKKANYLTGAAILTATVAFTKVVGAVYKIPLYNILGDAGTGHFNVMYNIYTLILTLSTAGVPVAVSRLISESRAASRPLQARRYFRIGLVSFLLIGLAAMGIMYRYAHFFADELHDPEVYLGVRILSPAVFSACVVAVLRGEAQGRNDMVPTAVSQIIEVLCKLVFGLAIAWYLKSAGYSLPVIAAGAIAGVTIGLAADVPVLALMRRRARRGEAAGPTLDKPDPVWRTVWNIFSVSFPIMLSSSILNIINILDTGNVRDCLASGAGMSQEMVDVLYGVYSKGLTLFSVPNAFLSPIAVAVVPVISAAIATGQFTQAKTTMESSMRVTNLLAMPAAVGLTVLAGPIFQVVFPNSNENGPVLLALLGIASYFVCAYLITNSILQASGYQWLAMLSMPVGGVIKYCVNDFFVSKPEVNILGAPIGTLACYVAITGLNILIISLKVRERPDFLKISLRPLLCSVLMGAAAWGVNGLCARFLLPALGGGRLAGAVCLALTVAAAVLIYAVLIVGLRALTKEDILLLPKGEKLAKLLKIR